MFMLKNNKSNCSVAFLSGFSFGLLLINHDERAILNWWITIIHNTLAPGGSHCKCPQFQFVMQMALVKGSKRLPPHKNSYTLICAAPGFLHIYAQQLLFTDSLNPLTTDQDVSESCVF